jgi:hypothetical protein
MKWLRKLFGFRRPELSRAQLCDALYRLEYIASMQRHDLRLACLHGLWRTEHPLSAEQQIIRAKENPKRCLILEPVKIEFHQQ